MADAEEPQFQTLAQRIAALKHSQAADQGGQTQNGTLVPAGKRPPPPPVPKSVSAGRPVNDFRSKSVPNGSALNRSVDNEPAVEKDILPPPALDREIIERNPRLSERIPKRPPPLPTRKASQQALNIPPLPARRPSDQLVVRKASNDSFRSTHSMQSTFSYGGSKSSASSIDSYARRLPPRLEDAELPPLPPTKREQEEKASQAKQATKREQEEKARLAKQARPTPVFTQSSPALPRITRQDVDPVRPARPPLPSRSSKAPPTPARSQTTMPIRGFRDEGVPPPMPRPSSANTAADSGPPPIPTASRPSMRQIEAIKARHATNTDSCLICRDFSGPDAVAAQHPRQSIPRGNSVDYLADALCGPFTSLTDKARAIFMWCHLNIDYDVDAFFGNRVKAQTADETIRNGAGVCAGYAGVFSAIAVRGGLECLVVGGHGKGYGYTPLAPGQRVPPEAATGHAWNAVRIDGGEWKLCDPCWGAGSVADKRYVRGFNASQFTCSNEDFGLKHFPGNKAHFFRADRSVPTWEAYYVGPLRGVPPHLYDTDSHGIDKNSFLPAVKDIEVAAGGSTRFQFAKLCPHWDFERNGKGKPYCMAIKIGGEHAYAEDLVVMERDEMYWWVDIPNRQLGSPGETVSAYAIETMSGEDARGMTKREFLERRKTSGMSFGGLAAWDLV